MYIFDQVSGTLKLNIFKIVIDFYIQYYLFKLSSQHNPSDTHLDAWSNSLS